MTMQSSISRRHFLMQAAVVSSAPSILLSGWAQTAPSDRIHLGCIGLGVQGRGLMGGFLGRKEVQVVAVCDVDTNRREDRETDVDVANRHDLHFLSPQESAHHFAALHPESDATEVGSVARRGLRPTAQKNGRC